MVYLILMLLIAEPTVRIELRTEDAFSQSAILVESPEEKIKGGSRYFYSYFDPDSIMNVTDTEYTFYMVYHYNVEIGDSIVWIYYYPDMDTTTGQPTGGFKHYNKVWWLYTDYDSVNYRLYYEYG